MQFDVAGVGGAGNGELGRGPQGPAGDRSGTSLFSTNSDAKSEKSAVICAFAARTPFGSP